MFFYIIKRLLLAGATLFAILFASYAMLRLAPGDPTRSNLFGSDSAGSAVDAEKGGLMRNTALREKLDGASENWNLKTVWGVGYKFEVL